MGARPSSFKKGGGFLNGVDGVISDYAFTDEFNGQEFKPGKDPKTKKERFHSLNCVLSARVDGADEDVTTTLFVGGFDDFEISDDGHTLTPVEDGRELGAGTAFAKLITSLVEAGFPETLLPEDSIDFSSIIGTRVRFVQRTNVEDTKKLGKRKGKDGKEYERQDLVVDQVYSLPGDGEEVAPAKGKAAKGTAAKPAAKGTKASKKDDGAELNDLAKETLLSIVADADGKIQKSKLSMKVLTKLMKHAQREDVRKLIFTDDFLTQEDGWKYDAAKGVITVE